MAKVDTKLSNEELITALQTAERNSFAARSILTQLWERNRGLINTAVHRATGLTVGQDGFEDMRQQAYFGFYEAAYSYRSGEAGFATYVLKRVEWSLIRYHRQNGRLVYIPLHIQDKLNEMYKTQRRLEAETGRTISEGEALRAMGLSECAAAAVLKAMQAQATVSIDAPTGENNTKDGEGVTVADLLADGEDVGEIAIVQEWRRELQDLLAAAIQALPEKTQNVITEHYYTGKTLDLIACEHGVTRAAIHSREQKGFAQIRAGKYGAQLALFCPTTSSKAKAERLIKKDREALKRLELTDTEKGLLIL